MNRVTITGRLTRDPELSDRDGTPICDLRIAENARNGEPTYVDVAVFRRQAEACAQHLRKGRLVGVTGRLRYSEWQAADGSKRSKHSIVAERVEFLDRREEKNSPPSDRVQAQRDEAATA
jgi:single-strand DNA-binding protein